MTSAKDIQKLQDRLLKEIINNSPEHSLSESLQRAFRACPRHSFIHEFKIPGDLEFRRVDSAEAFQDIYTDRALVLSEDNDGNFLSTNSQPSFILPLINSLEILPGQHVLEIGSGSGWLAAILGYLVGETGTVTGIEIIEFLATRSITDLKALGIENVEIVSGDGLEKISKMVQCDRVVITAGCNEIPDIVIDRTKVNGLILFPKIVSGMESNVLLMRKGAKGLDIVAERPGYFVPLVLQTGGNESQ